MNNLASSTSATPKRALDEIPTQETVQELNQPNAKKSRTTGKLDAALVDKAQEAGQKSLDDAPKTAAAPLQAIATSTLAASPSASEPLSEEQKLAREFETRIGRCLPAPKPDKDKVLLPEGSFYDMDKISVCGNHYIASSLWMYCHKTALMFWKTVVLNRPSLIVKLVHDISYRYWPQNEGDTLQLDAAFPKLTCIKKEQITDKIVKRVIEVALENESFIVAHINFLEWPDFGTPRRESFEALMKAVDQESPSTLPNKRILVHCLGGMGRTGTFIAGHAAKAVPAVKRTQDLLFSIIMDMRSQRQRTMVETAKQYVFLHQFLKDQS